MAAMIPECGGQYATLPVGRHAATMEEIYEDFVVAAPFRPRRELIFRALELQLDLLREYFTDAKVWINGGFATKKPWAAPEDADIVVVVPLVQYSKAMEDRCLPLWTLQNVTASPPDATTSKLHPMGGLIDAFCIPDMPAALDAWDRNWSLVKDEDGQLLPGVNKGYLEVIL
jgi:hypothetical protein